MNKFPLVAQIKNKYFELIFLIKTRSLYCRKNLDFKTITKIGFNVSGFFSHTLGVSSSAKAITRSLQLGNEAVCVNNIQTGAHEKTKIENELASVMTMDNSYPINLINVNPPEMLLALRQYGVNYFKNKLNVGLWYWELEKLPKSWKSYSKPLDQVFVTTDFIKKTIQSDLGIPVLKITFPFFPEDLAQSRAEAKVIFNKKFPHINIEEKFIFLFSFDFKSSFERKNPLGVVEAFKKAFPNENGKELLIIKSTNAKFYSKERERLGKSVGTRKDIYLIDEILPKAELNSLFNLCDAYISLHRSEGLGIGLMSAMSLGKITIATNYSGNLEFMNNKNSFLIDYKLVTIKKRSGEYKHGHKWAEPDLEQAIKTMREVTSASELVEAKKRQAKDDILVKHNYVKTKTEIKTAIENLIRANQ